ncbi:MULTISPECIES: DUF982 domain-containing protein [Rhizobium]|uniref:DUF982 domain-containing protein n=1 Tax=Rhizobium laguerreae TaxID=1076926 RepID=A0A7Y2RC81_9HYPH|nr:MULTISPECIES: DUF982 domain-containing protein [Rhizobium]MBY5405923.1 DUF982 domain-containing protein [Rhizobium leguminosarum]MBY5460802.1 DUF982 domain-containing protein [Rhizobium leguminosarum]NDK49422.1 DUF982 domain-containing protein [Rhizobium laguerreae]NNH68171.1 DUF982 domain-containing protein [Rhizobium laguerreae]UWM84868.1 DUF982 domain-containing protein [Rhizobium leguminosarum bv. viciae]
MDWDATSAFTPVGLALRGQPVHRIIRTLGDAAYMLLKDWPSDDGEEYVTAVKACVDAISGQIAPEQFRDAFLRAADEAGIAAITIVTKTTMKTDSQLHISA